MRKHYAALTVSVISAMLLLTACTSSRSVAASVQPSAADAVLTDTVNAQSFADAELARAVQLGIGEYREDNGAVTYGEYMAMLDLTVALADETKLAFWQEVLPDAHSSDKAMTRREGMVGLYLAAEALGEEYYSYNNNAGWQTFEKISAADPSGFWDEMLAGDYSLFPDIDKPTLNGESSYVNAGYFYSMLRISASCNKTVFDYDTGKNSMRPAEPFTYQEALLAALRLYDSGNINAGIAFVNTREPVTDADKELLALIDARREAILNSPSAITVTGTSYYVSNDGSDENDGLTPETAWATATKVNGANLQSGDGVFFRRGDLWRGDMISGYQEGISYSAYGEGAKPAFYGSPENGSGEGKWTLLEGTQNIWVYSKAMPFMGSIVMNGGEAVATQHLSFWNGTMYTEYGTQDVPVDITGIDLSSWGNDPEHYNGNGNLTVYSCPETGPLYLRCDAGDPGKLYSEIEFGVGWGFMVGGGCTVDNLCIMYVGNCAVMSDPGSPQGITASNCKIGFMGDISV